MGSKTENFKEFLWYKSVTTITDVFSEKYIQESGSTPAESQARASRANDEWEAAHSKDHGNFSGNPRSDPEPSALYEYSGGGYYSGSGSHTYSGGSGAFGKVLKFGIIIAGLSIVGNYMQRIDQAQQAYQEQQAAMVQQGQQPQSQMIFVPDSQSKGDLEERAVPDTETIERKTPPIITQNLRGVGAILVPIGRPRPDGPFGSAGTVDSVQLYYGNRMYFHISRAQYPKLYEQLDIDKDGKVDAMEVNIPMLLIDQIARRYPVGDIEDIVKEFTGKR